MSSYQGETAGYIDFKKQLIGLGVTVCKVNPLQAQKSVLDKHCIQLWGKSFYQFKKCQLEINYQQFDRDLCHKGSKGFQFFKDIPCEISISLVKNWCIYLILLV